VNLQERAELTEATSGGTAYLVTVLPQGGVMVDRHHPDGGNSGIAYGAFLPEAEAIRTALERFKRGSSYEGKW
jgi:hypothetical protein